VQKGKADGPQKTPRRAAPKPIKDGAEVVVPAVHSEDIARSAYGSLRGRLIDEVERLAEVMRQLPPADDLPAGREVPVGELRSAEQRISEVRVRMDQLLDNLP
jgi:hypothetical protein